MGGGGGKYIGAAWGPGGQSHHMQTSFHNTCLTISMTSTSNKSQSKQLGAPIVIIVALVVIGQFKWCLVGIPLLAYICLHLPSISGAGVCVCALEMILLSNRQYLLVLPSCSQPYTGTPEHPLQNCQVGIVREKMGGRKS